MLTCATDKIGKYRQRITYKMLPAYTIPTHGRSLETSKGISVFTYALIWRASKLHCVIILFVVANYYAN